MHGHRAFRVPAPALALCTLAWGCGGSGESGPGGSTFTSTVSVERAGEMGGVAGTWELSLDEDGTFTMTGDGEIAVTGRYTVAGDRITFLDQGGPLMCAEDPEASYAWSLSEDAATFTSLDDTCPGRLSVLASGPLAREGS